ncbi:MAG: hemerythrin domain-containing protein [Bacteroidales bacterium]|jgi:regulator of cell morphogenesis and NO signaling|nr:hemerythrin domain-containing protein [Bacteroidales bacterium]
MNNGLFSEKMKLADLALTNCRLLYVFPLFGIEIGMGEITVKNACEKHGISTDFFLLVCNLYTFDEYMPDSDTLSQISLKDVLKYLRNSHTDYLKNRMPEIKNQILKQIDGSSAVHIKMLTEFCEKYIREVIIHFDYEENVVYPYISALLNGDKPKNYNIKQYEDNHSNIDAALEDLKNIIIKYLPPECTIEKWRDVLFDLFLFEDDLSKHTLIEDKVLISVVERIENAAKK